MTEERSVTFIYTSYKGLTAARIATPLSVFWGATEWHPEEQWLLEAFDHERNAVRVFALSECNFVEGET